jgi:CHAT domain-containing protein
MKSAEIYSLIIANKISALSELIINAPEATNKEFALQLLKINDPLAIINALSPLCIEYTYGKNCEFGVELSKACFTYAKEVYEQQNGNSPLMLMTVSRFLLNTVNGLNTLGRFQETISLIDNHLKFFTSRNAVENISSIVLAKVFALLNINKIDDADKLITSMNKNKIEWDAKIEYDRLFNLILKLKRKVTDTRGNIPMHENISPLTDLLKDGTDLYGELDKGIAFITGEGKEMNQWKADKITRDSTKIFLGKPTREEINVSLRNLLDLREWTKEHGTRSSDNDVLWGLYLCYSRLENFSSAADFLLEMQKNHEGLRSMIKNPIERAGVYSNYPYFFGALCKTLILSNRTCELINAIESSKGRAIADILTEKTDHIVADSEISNPANELPLFCKKYNFHYLTYFVDDEEVFAVLVTKDSKLHHSSVIKINKQDLRRATHYANPENWGKVLYVNGLRTEIAPSSEILSPLVAWLEPLMKEKILKQDDHICYSPDENIFNVPLHYLQFMGKELFETFSVSRVHGAFSLILSFNKNQEQPAKHVSFIVPTKQDKEDKSPDGVYEGLLKTQKLLGEILDGKTYLETKATKEALTSCDSCNKIIHFGTHGIFPESSGQSDQNPFRSSGLLLSDNKNLPDRNKIEKGQDLEMLLTPEDILNSKINLTDSHVTMQACVSGLAKEGIGGDALGLEWAMLQAGAKSILSTHWNIEAIHSLQFLKKFYTYWLLDKNTKAESWRKSVLEMKMETSNPYAFTAYSLTGNWT